MFIYVVENTMNGKCYVGKTTTTVNQRFLEHLFKARHGSKCAIHCALRKYGKDNFKVRQLDSASDKADLNTKEIFWIEKLNSFRVGYNMTSGGDGGCKMSNEVIDKMTYPRPDRDLLYNLYVCDQLTLQQIGERFDVSVALAHHWMKHYGIYKNPSQSAIVELVKQGKSQSEIGKIFNKHQSTISRWLE